MRKNFLNKCMLSLFIVISFGLNAERTQGDNKIVYSWSKSIYVKDAYGQEPVEILSKTLTNITQECSVYDAYFNPSLSPDQTKVAAIRIRNYHECNWGNFETQEAYYEALIYNPTTKEEVVFYQISGNLEKEVASPIWSHDGKKVYFVSGMQLLSYELEAKNTAEIANFSDTFYTWRDSNYIKLSSDGNTIYALLPNAGDWKLSIWEVDLITGTSTTLGTHGISDIYNKVYNVPTGLPNSVVTSLFGSREFPVLNPQFSSDRSFYSFFIYREGFFARYWIGGYDLETKEDFVIKTVRWAYYTE